MKVETMLNYALLDRLVKNDRAFLLFREPQSIHFSLAVFSTTAVSYLYNLKDLDDKSGFVFAPFEPDERHPIVQLDAPDLYIGEAAIDAYLRSIGPDDPSQEVVKTKPLQSVDVDALEKQDYEEAFGACHDAILRGDCQKIVLSRRCVLPKPDGFSAARLFHAACDTYPEAYVYLFHTPSTGTWLGSTPEALLTGDGRQWETVALAGTQSINSPQTAAWDDKNRQEQQIVSDYVEQLLKELGLHAKKLGPYPVKAAQLEHLKTTFRFELPLSMEMKLGTLIHELHPTPATCGFPKARAMELIRQHERHDRSYYCVFIGSMRVNGSTHLYVNLRCMCIKPETLVLYAGGGIMADSSCEAEWEETESKLRTLLSLLD